MSRLTILIDLYPEWLLFRGQEVFHGESNPASFRLRGRYGNAKTNNVCGSMSAKPSRFVTSSFTCATSTPNLCGPSEKEVYKGIYIACFPLLNFISLHRSLFY